MFFYREGTVQQNAAWISEADVGWTINSCKHTININEEEIDHKSKAAEIWINVKGHIVEQDVAYSKHDVS